MQRPTLFIGIDPAADTFTAALYHPDNGVIATLGPISNDHEGFSAFEQGLLGHGCTAGSTMICVESTGVYAEHLCYWLHSRHWRVALESPVKLKKSFHARAKTDEIDAQQIAEYAWRYTDRLELWQPNDAIVEQMGVLLGMREQLGSQLTANRNALKAVERKYVDTPAARQIYGEMIVYLKERIRTIDTEIRRLINDHPTLAAMVTTLLTAPGVGLLMAANFVVLTGGFTRPLHYRHMASYLGICPYEHTSGRTVHRKARSCGFGHARMRKLLYLAALSVRQHHVYFHQYYLRKVGLRKVGEGKSGRLVINNIANTLLRVLCAMINNATDYKPDYRADRRQLPASALTLS